MSTALTPARLCFTENGTPWSESYADVYHSADGGPGQARHVFLQGNDLPERWRDRDRFVILETGFGTGLNFLVTWAAWRADPRRPRRLHYLSVERHPFAAPDLAVLHANWPELAELSAQLRTRWPTAVPGWHRREFVSGGIVLTLLLGDIENVVRRLDVRPDAIYLDGFSPAKNAAMWSTSVLTRIGRIAAPGCSLATWTVAGAVREGLRVAGFAVEKRRGYGHKREMLVARFAPPPYRPPAPVSAPPSERRAMVIGAGLAGCACAERLAARGWEVDLLDRHAAPGQAASGNLAGVVMPLVSRDDNIASRLTRAAFLHTLDAWQQAAAQGCAPPWSDCGVVQLARDDRQEALQRSTAEALAYPVDFLRFLDRDQLGAWLGQRTGSGGWLFPRGGWANPPGVCRSLLAVAGKRVRALYGVEVARLDEHDGSWRARNAAGRIVAESPVVIFADGAETHRLRPTAALPLQRVRGQVSLVARGRLPPLAAVLCREGYATPAVHGLHCFGASYALDADPVPRIEDHRDNLVRLERLLPGSSAALDPAELAARVGFRAVAPDRLPLAGAVPDMAAAQPGADGHLGDLVRSPGVHCLLGLASRGLVWSGLMAEVLASRIEAEPLPLESDLVAAVDPGRFLLRQIRRQG